MLLYKLKIKNGNWTANKGKRVSMDSIVTIYSTQKPIHNIFDGGGGGWSLLMLNNNAPDLKFEYKYPYQTEKC